MQQYWMTVLSSCCPEAGSARARAASTVASLRIIVPPVTPVPAGSAVRRPRPAGRGRWGLEIHLGAEEEAHHGVFRPAVVEGQLVVVLLEDHAGREADVPGEPPVHRAADRVHLVRVAGGDGD